MPTPVVSSVPNNRRHRPFGFPASSVRWPGVFDFGTGGASSAAHGEGRGCRDAGIGGSTSGLPTPQTVSAASSRSAAATPMLDGDVVMTPTVASTTEKPSLDASGQASVGDYALSKAPPNAARVVYLGQPNATFVCRGAPFLVVYGDIFGDIQLPCSVVVAAAGIEKVKRLRQPALHQRDQVFCAAAEVFETLYNDSSLPTTGVCGSVTVLKLLGKREVPQFLSKDVVRKDGARVYGLTNARTIATSIPAPTINSKTAPACIQVDDTTFTSAVRTATLIDPATSENAWCYEKACKAKSLEANAFTSAYNRASSQPHQTRNNKRLRLTK